MAKTIGEVSWAAQLWTPAVQQRFEALFAVASRKSLSGCARCQAIRQRS